MEGFQDGIPEGATPIFDENDTSGMGDVLNTLHEQVYQMAKDSGNAPKNFREDVEAFVAAVDWSEKWIQALLITHVLLWIVTIITRKNFTWQCCTFFFVCIVVWSAETLNTLAHNNWTTFSKQDYFDTHGFFTSVMLAGPMLLLSMYQMVNFLITASYLLVDVKREELKRSKQVKGSESESTESKSEPATSS
eukprot:CAMPEP_0114351094 /NCGR_PEP_ID=MMETSP0101-20121206/16905_1 /TAXON_ID=38822 ORGANISM="Pteridomonas danica, Strain PT" /NCGR_SAMPLE_ID=MMETSP0101 /ASSEMBLY_ACC=CAM_ASM_000211 /LENGTH=191 /DNA_ID=CAMNT_0001490757 /DNA_START=1 /DNA_END=572 /DNA_ORIENTATION=-